ncbi:MAG: hypothetical protein DWI48_01850 [Chloroflexi bacterium]|nr:MAG: hypothetical protein DWI48_01850 [Chloroflexota bacterium]
MRWWLEIIAALICALAGLVLLYFGIAGLASLTNGRSSDSGPWFIWVVEIAYLTGSITALRQAWRLVREKDLF